MNRTDKPAFLITIDTEGDSAWARPRVIETRNAAHLARFQALCERFGFKPTYLTNYEMAQSPVMLEFGLDVIRRGAGEIGMHLHAWNSPPLQPLTPDDLHHQPFLIEYPTTVLQEKVRFLTDLLEQRFGTKMLSHRAGRWSFDSRYARVLADQGYLVDCSVTPTVSWRKYLGDPTQQGGTDYSEFPGRAYFMDLDAIDRPGNSPLLELPMTIRRGRRHWAQHLPRVSERLPILGPRLSKSHWLRPHRGGLAPMLKVVADEIRDHAPYLEFMLHSSEFMPGANPNFVSGADIEALYGDLEQLFESVSRHCIGATLAEYAHQARAGLAPALGHCSA